MIAHGPKAYAAAKQRLEIALQTVLLAPEVHPAEGLLALIDILGDIIGSSLKAGVIDDSDLRDIRQRLDLRIAETRGIGGAH